MKTIIIAEAGVNHNGDLNLAKKLIDIASEADVDYVKFQTFKTEKIVSKSAQMANYQRNNLSRANDEQFAMLKRLELDIYSHEELIKYSKSRNIKFLSTPFDLESIDLLKSLNFDYWKIPSGEINNLIYLEKIGSFKEKVILSSGMSTLGEIETALKILTDAGTDKSNITVLHCNTEYPTPMSDVNLNAMITIANAFKVNVGYSDHTLGIEVPIAAVAMGASIIEKHFTLDKNLAGPDHRASLEPHELKDMVKAIRNIEQALGSGIKHASKSEIQNINVARKSIHLVKDLGKGHVLTSEDLTVKRPGDGISPMFIKELIGKKIKVSLPQDYKISFKDIEF